ncbi:Pentapeptide_repeats-containing protein [Hexamita inflata]|uniref:Pentapeptide repeats-containing protein n=1 Tax=Hexamita inflata TaxID=28002 RepID=A0AA86PCT0_9EUKA|nr:Pentapeptide repeats-containing protein [Hexamita inflata]
MGCGSANSVQTANTEQISGKTKPINQTLKISDDDGKDSEIYTLIGSLTDGLGSADENAYMDAIQKLNASLQGDNIKCDNPMKHLTDLLTVLTSNDVIGLEAYKKREIASICTRMMHRVYFKNKESGIKVATSQQQAWIDSVTAVRNLINNKKIEQNGLEFELDCIEAGLKVLSMGQTDMSGQIVDYAKQMMSAAQAAKGGSWDDMKALAITLVKQLVTFSGNKLNELWYLKVMTIQYTKAQLIEVIFQLLHENLKGDWHVLFACLDSIEDYLMKEVDSVDPTESFKHLDTLYLISYGTHAWRVREKVATVLITLTTSKNEATSKGAAKILGQMNFKEKNPLVLKTLRNEVYVKKVREKLVQNWSSEQAEAEVSEQQKLLDSIEAKMQKSNDQTELQSLKHQYEEEKKKQVENLDNLKQMADNFNLKLNVIQEADKKLQQQTEIIQNMNAQASRIQKAVQGQNAPEMVQMMKKYIQKQIEGWKAEIENYIPQLGLVANQKVVVQNEVKEFVTSDKKVMLIHGGAGSGKTTIAKQLVKDFMESDFIPLYIYLPSLMNWEHKVVESTLKQIKMDLKDNEVNALKDSKQKILFIMDGYDELQTYANLYISNKIQQWDQCKVLFMSRSAHLTVKPAYQKFFVPTSKQSMLVEVQLQNFDDAQILQYIDLYIRNGKSQKWSDTQQYIQNIKTIPGVRQLIETPQILAMIVQLLPGLVQKRENISKSEKQQELIAVDLYEEFANQWFETQSAKEENNTNSQNIQNIRDEYQVMSVSIANKMIQEKVTIVDCADAEQKEKWTEYFASTDPFTNTVILGVPINMQNQQYSFIYKSLQYYFASVGALQQAELISAADADNNGLDSAFNKFFIKNHEVLQFIGEHMIKQTGTDKLLIQIIQMSKNKPELAIAASNAITILNEADFNFTGLDLSDTNIPDANLGAALMDSVNFSRADLTNANFQQAWLAGSKFDGAKMEGVDFGAKIQIKVGSLVDCVVFDKRSQLIASGDGKKHVKIWNKNGKLIKTLKGHEEQVTSLAFCLNQNYIVSGSDDKTIIMWDISQEKIVKTFQGHTSAINCVAVSPDGKSMVSGSCDTTAKVWDLETGKEKYILKGHINDVYTVSYNVQGTVIATGSSDKTIKLWDAQSGELLQSLEGHRGAVYSLIFDNNNPDSLISGSQDYCICVWNYRTAQLIKTLSGHKDTVTGLALNSTSDILISSSADESVGMWNIHTSEMIKSFVGHSSTVRSLTFMDDDTFVSGGWDRTIRVWNAVFEESIKSLSGHLDRVSSVCFSPDFKYVGSSSYDNTSIIWDASSGELISTFTGHSGAVTYVNFSSDSKRLISCGYDGCVKVSLAGVEEQSYQYTEPLKICGFGKDIHALDQNGDAIQWMKGRKEAIKLTKFEVPDQIHVNKNNQKIEYFDKCVVLKGKDGKIIWISGEYPLNLKGCSIQEVQSLSEENRILFE